MDKNFFSYNDLANKKWGELLHDAQKNFNVYFDLENDNPVSQREIIISQKEWEFTKCKFKCEMFSAGGDWEYPVKYFRCQLVDGYAFGIEKYRDSGMFIFIPGKTEGNYQLVRNKLGGDEWHAPDNNDYKKDIDPEPDEKKCWEALNKYLTDLVNKEIENTRKERMEQTPEARCMQSKKDLRKFLEVLMSYDKDVEREINVAGAIIYRFNHEEKIPEILMIRRSPDDNWPNVWEFPRGKCDRSPKEKIIDCLKREVGEEAGLKFKVIAYLNKYTYVADKGKRRSTQYNFLCKLLPPDQEVRLSKEHSEYKWVSAKGQVDILASGEIEDTLNLALQRIVELNV